MTALTESDFARVMRRDGLSPRTTTLYRQTFARLVRDCDELGIDLDTADVDELDLLVERWPRSRASRQAVRSALSHYWEATGRFDAPLRALRVPRKVRPRCRALSPSDAGRLRSVATARGDLPGLAVLLGLFCGLRRAEIASLRWTDFSVDEVPAMLTVIGKGDRIRAIPVHPMAMAAVSSAPRSGPWVFPGADGARPAHPSTIWLWVRNIGAAAGVSELTTHQLRHTCLATMLDGTGDLGAVQDFAGHASPQTTRTYTRTSGARMAAAVAALDAMGETDA